MRWMHKKSTSVACLVFAGLMLRCSGAFASSFNIVADLGSPRINNGVEGYGGISGVLAADADGNLYAEAAFSNSHPNGGIYEITARSGYSKVKVLYYFPSLSEGVDAEGGITFTDHNDMLGIVAFGGEYSQGNVFNLGTPRKLSQATLHSFYGGLMRPADGAPAVGNLISGPFARYYGVTSYGGLEATRIMGTGDGTVYTVSPSTTDPKYKVLHRFGAVGDGVAPNATALATDAQGQLYGSTFAGGANGAGTVFMMQHANGGWKEQVIYSFQVSNDLQYPTGNVVLDSAGNLYGCANGGTHNQGGIFRLSPPAQAGGAWQESILYNFGDQADDPSDGKGGSSPSAYTSCGITLDPKSNLIVGTSPYGGKRGQGTIFTLTPPLSGQTSWTETVGYSFKNHYSTGFSPSAAPFQLGSVYYGGTPNSGAIYAFTP